MKAKPPIARIVVLLLVVGGAAAYGIKRYLDARAPYEWSGTVEAHTIDLGSRAGGRVKDVLVREGDTVKAGQVIIQLEAGDWPAQLAQARASLAQVQAAFDRVKAGARPEEIAAAQARAQSAQAALQESRAGTRPEEVAAAKARVVAQDVAVEKAQHDADRMHKLDAAGAAIKADVDNADIGLRGAIAQRDVMREQLVELQNGSRHEDVAQANARSAEQTASAKLVEAGSRAEDIRVAQAQVEGAQGKVDQIQTMIDELQIRSSRPARVEAIELRPGDIIAPNATAATLLEDDQLFVRIYVPETRLGQIKVGQEVPIEVDSFPGETFTGVVEHINMVGEYSPRNLQTADERADQVFATRIGIKTGEGKLRAGMAAFIQVPH
jgi:HlyD family secretion protein